MAWDAPEPYGIACKRIDARDPATHSAFNSKRTMPDALRQVVRSVDCELLVLSYNDEAWLGVDELETLCGEGRDVATLAFDSARYVGARIGIFDPSGVKVGRVSHLSNQELLVIAGEGALVRRVVDAVGRVAGGGGASSRSQPRAEAGSASIGGVTPHPDHGYARLEDADLSARLFEGRGGQTPAQGATPDPASPA